MAECESRKIDPEKSNRSCGFLTPTERDYLMGKWTAPDRPQENAKRHDIKTRIRHALADFLLLVKYADEDLKRNVVLEDAEPPVFIPEQTDHLWEGLARYAAEAAAGEAAAGAMFEGIHEPLPEPYIETVDRMITNQRVSERDMVELFELFCQQPGVSKDKTLGLLQREFR